jgi:hypothetical protein
VLNGLDVKRTSIATPLDCTSGGIASSLKMPSSGEDVLAPSYTVTLSVASAGYAGYTSVLKRVKPRRTLPPASALSSHMQLRLSAYGVPGADPSEKVCTLALTGSLVVPEQELALPSEKSPHSRSTRGNIVARPSSASRFIAIAVFSC